MTHAVGMTHSDPRTYSRAASHRMAATPPVPPQLVQAHGRTPGPDGPRPGIGRISAGEPEFPAGRVPEDLAPRGAIGHQFLEQRQQRAVVDADGRTQERPVRRPDAAIGAEGVDQRPHERPGVLVRRRPTGELDQAGQLDDRAAPRPRPSSSRNPGASSPSTGSGRPQWSTSIRTPEWTSSGTSTGSWSPTTCTSATMSRSARDDSRPPASAWCSTPSSAALSVTPRTPPSRRALSSLVVARFGTTATPRNRPPEPDTASSRQRLSSP